MSVAANVNENRMNETSIVALMVQHYPSAEAIYVFGSYARDEAWPQSDVDLALLLPPAEAFQEKGIACSDCYVALAEALGKEVDLVNLRTVSTVFQHEIIHSGRRIFTLQEEAVLAFEMQVLSAYQKLNEERKAILESFFASKRAYAL